MKQSIIVAGIGTDVGKTVVSAILVYMLGAKYWKPIGTGEKKDREVLQELLEDKQFFYREAYHFSAPCSPHEAARQENIVPKMEEVEIPAPSQQVVIESAGGILVPFNHQFLTIDLFAPWKCSWIVVSKNYLGSINHTLLSIEALKSRDLPILGIIFNGEESPSSEEYIQDYTQLPVLGRMRQEKTITRETIRRYSKLWLENPVWQNLMAR
ncbi:MAG: dethiobiotin synthase [Simkaniaceae bacterium]